jgi:hypothetical protein
VSFHILDLGLRPVDRRWDLVGITDDQGKGGNVLPGKTELALDRGY